MVGANFAIRMGGLYAHIIPRAFYHKEADFHFAVVNMTKVDRPRRSQKGVWDDTILCEQCEARFASIDEYAAETLHQRRIEALPVVQDGNMFLDRNGSPLAFALPWADGEQIIWFALFVLWRAGASSRNECKTVATWTFRGRRIPLAIDRQDLSELVGVHVTLWWERNPNLAGAVIFPYRGKIGPVRLWNFWCGGYYFVIQTDSRPNVFSGSPNLLGKKRDVFAISTSLLERKEGVHMARTMKELRQLYGDPWKGRWKPPAGSQSRT